MLFILIVSGIIGFFRYLPEIMVVVVGGIIVLGGISMLVKLWDALK
jgi:hypothetical protein